MPPSSDKDDERAIRAPTWGFVALGSNLPHQGLAGAELLAVALGEMAQEGLKPFAASSAWGSPAWPAGSGQPDYVNAVAAIETGGRAPEETLARLLAIERRFGRVRGGERWAARTLDLDLIAQGDLVREAPDPILPHPRMHERGFVLAPLAEIAPEWSHPVLRLTAAALLARLDAEPPKRLGPIEF